MPSGIYKHKKGPESPCWKGDSATAATGRWRANALYPGPHACLYAGCDVLAQRHHKDGNTLNNSPENIEFWCVHHHAGAEDRGRHRRGKKRADLTAEQRRELAERLVAQNRARKGAPHSDQHNSAVSAGAALAWAKRRLEGRANFHNRKQPAPFTAEHRAALSEAQMRRRAREAKWVP